MFECSRSVLGRIFECSRSFLVLMVECPRSVLVRMVECSMSVLGRMVDSSRSVLVVWLNVQVLIHIRYDSIFLCSKVLGCPGLALHHSVQAGKFDAAAPGNLLANLSFPIHC